jgi:hypothetical protein
MATNTAEQTTGRPQRLATYIADVGERNLVGQRVDGVVRISDVPADGQGRSYLVEPRGGLDGRDRGPRRRLPRQGPEARLGADARVVVSVPDPDDAKRWYEFAVGERERFRSANKNADLAWDVAAMSTDCGVLLYRVGEDADGRPTVLCPLELRGQRERVDQIVRTSLAEVPYIDVRELPLERDPSRGYLLIVVPASARASHQVIVKGTHQHRFYGRGPTGNRVLSEGDIARLYERRQHSEVDREQILREIVSVAPEQAPSASRAHMHAFARPVFPDQDVWRRARLDAGNHGVIAALTEAATRTAAPGGYEPALHAHGRGWQAQGAEVSAGA